MDTEKLKINAEVYGTRAKAKLRMLVGFAGLLLVGLGAYNLLLAPVLDMSVYAPYRGFGLVSNSTQEVAYFVGDFVVMGIGGLLAWFS